MIQDMPLLVIVALAINAYWRHAQVAQVVKVSNTILITGLMAATLLAMNQVHDNAWPFAIPVLLILAQRALADSERAAVGPTVGALALIAFMTFADAISMMNFVVGQRDEVTVAYCDDRERPACRLGLMGFPADVLAKMSPLPTIVEDAETPPRDLATLYRECDTNAHCVWWLLQEDLVRRLNRNILPQDRPLYLGFMNMLPYFYGLEPPRGVLSWMDVGRNLSLTAHLDPDIMLDDATVVVVPHLNADMGFSPELMAIYGPKIRESYTAVADNALWSIWRRKPAD
jgi:hypothetical protein